MGDLVTGVRFSPHKSLEFLLRVGEPGGDIPSVEITPDNCKTSCAGLNANGDPVFESVHPGTNLHIRVHSTAGPGPRLLKSLTIENVGSKALVVFDIVLERLSVPSGIKLSGGGRGWPVFIQGIGFAAVEFPECENTISGSQYTLEYYPAVTLEPGEIYESESAVFEFAPSDPYAGLRAYADEFKLHKSKDLFSFYSSWGAHEHEGPNESIINKQLDHATELKTKWRIPFQYFVVDYGYWRDDIDPSESGDFACIDDENRFPGDGFEKIARRIQNSGLKLGMWFGNGCLASDEYASNLKRSLLELNSKYGLKLVRADFRNWDCGSVSHGHLPGKYMRYKAARNLMDVLSALKAGDSEVVVHGIGFTRSPWWLKYVDFVSIGEDDTSDIPAPSLRDSLLLETDVNHHFFEIDSGTSIGYSDSYFWCGKQFWRKNLVMSISRSNQIAISGELQLFSEDDKLFLQRMTHMRKVHAGSFGSAKHVLGDPAEGDVYGYANIANGRGLIALFNPSWQARNIQIKAADLGCDPSVRNICVQLFPDTEVTTIPSAEGCFHAQIDPWEVLWLEAGPSEEHCELLESKAKLTTSCSIPVTQVLPPEEIAQGMLVPLERTDFHTGSMFRCRPFIPRSWDGYPFLIELSGLRGELYVNNHPFGSKDYEDFELFYSWTPEYGRVLFGEENLFYLATNDVGSPHQGRINFQPAAYYSSSACREDWPYEGGATMVVVVRYTKDGEPFRPSLDPRTAECAVWLDGIWMEPYRVPPTVPQIRSGFSWSVFMLDLESDWECVRILVPKLMDSDYEVEFFLTDRISASAYAREI